MKRIVLVWLGLVLAALPLGGCLGYVRGVESVPYFGENQPEADKYLDFSGVSIYVDVKNTTTTHEAFWIGREVPLLPVYLSVREKPTFGWKLGDPLQIKTIVNIQRPGFLFDPAQLVLTVGEQEYALKSALVHHGPGPAEAELKPVAKPMVLDDTSGPYQFTLIFAQPTLPPQEIMILDLSRALRHPELPGLPKIHFSKVSWSRWYSRDFSAGKP
ncbi:hypothetical protein DESUT3_16190 [Desulfuromonas versatilis]|uniref:DUF4382 domain-containing protein n=1 Tax=Desulfuromonas versatilis TaxID=2802975 RepID=A0ABM8HV15_9BACT|nr:hypothetical protein [Desulfuromonas versatilis]BCR04550.1 hypothetical protein DESUT3_16190 [Desulfuromonas versatilis]